MICAKVLKLHFSEVPEIHPPVTHSTSSQPLALPVAPTIIYLHNLGAGTDVIIWEFSIVIKNARHCSTQVPGLQNTRAQNRHDLMAADGLITCWASPQNRIVVVTRIMGLCIMCAMHILVHFAI